MNKRPEKCKNCNKNVKHLKKYTGRCDKWIGKYLCKMCFQKTPRNPFFLEVKDRPTSKITKFTMSQAEKVLLFKRYHKQGYSPDNAWHQINKVVYGMRMAKMRKTKALKDYHAKKTAEISTKKLISDKFKKSFDTLK